MIETAFNYKQLMAKKEAYKKKYLKLNPELNNDSGIYTYYREDEDGNIKFYSGQSLHILDRLVSHSMGYQQHIDRSIKAHGLWSEDNPHGYKVIAVNYPKEELDDKERTWICQYIELNWISLNKTSGGQDDQKRKLNEYTSHVSQKSIREKEKKKLSKEISHLFDLHLDAIPKNPQKPTKNQIKALDKFQEFLDFHKQEEGDNK